MKINKPQLTNLIKKLIKEEQDNNIETKKQNIFKFMLSIIDRYMSLPDNNNQKLLMDNYKKYITEYSLGNDFVEYIKTIPSAEKYLENLNGIKNMLKLETKIINIVKNKIKLNEDDDNYTNKKTLDYGRRQITYTAKIINNSHKQAGSVFKVNFVISNNGRRGNNYLLYLSPMYDMETDNPGVIAYDLTTGRIISDYVNTVSNAIRRAFNTKYEGTAQPLLKNKDIKIMMMPESYEYIKSFFGK
jgi:hypothetical protein